MTINYDRGVLMRDADGNIFTVNRESLERSEEREAHMRKHVRKQWRSFNDVIAENTTKSYVADARGDEADMQDEETPVDETVVDSEHHASKVADLLVESGAHADRSQALDWLLHHKNGAALLRRLNKKDTTMPTNAELHAFAKQAGVIEIAKRLVETGDPHEITEEQLVALISKHERRDGESEAQCFARNYEAHTEEGALIRKAVQIAKEAAPVVSVAPIAVGQDVQAATQALTRLVAELRAASPWMSAEAAWDRAMRERSDLAARAIPRPNVPIA